MGKKQGGQRGKELDAAQEQLGGPVGALGWDKRS